MTSMTDPNTTSAQKAILVSIAESGADVASCEASLNELERLLDTAGGECFAKVIQTKEKFDPRLCIGTGKAEEIRELCKANDIHLVIFDFELSPSQIRNLEDAFGDADVIDRSMLILDIFARHATTAEGKLQVEIAQLKYTAPRLMGKGKQLSRQEGRIGTRGPGESQLETDRRHLKARLFSLERQLEEVEKQRRTMRASRDRSGLVKVAIVGYTNAGKSTLLNRLTDAGVLCEDKLFATLDATTRRYQLPGGETLLLTDTVGFVRKLPHHLIEAFKSTLEEVTYADLLVIVADESDPEVNEQLEVTHSLMEDLHASDKPVLYVFNKCDRGAAVSVPVIRKEDAVVRVSALTGEGIDLLVARLEKMAADTKKTVELCFPYSDQGKVSGLYGACRVLEVSYDDDCIRVRVSMDKAMLGRYADYRSDK